MSGVLVRLFGGWRVVRIRGRKAERLLSQLAERGFRIWRVARRRDELHCLVTEEGYETLASLAEEMGVEVLSLRQGGLPFRWQQVRRRPFLLVGLASAWALVLYATSHIWAIEVVVPRLPAPAREQLVRAAETAGLRVGSTRSRLDIASIRRTMLAELPEYSWIGLHTHGMVAIIDAIRLVNRPPDHLPPRLIATANGTVTAVYVYMGAADVSRGETVHKGQTLISGVVSGELPGGGEKPQEESVVTPAEGQVMADVTYREKIFQPFKNEHQVETGRVFVRRFLEWNRSQVTEIPNLMPMSFTHYRETKVVTPVRFAGITLPVRFIEMVYNETVIKTVPLSAKGAVQLGRDRALEALARTVPAGGQRVSQSIAVSPQRRGVWITATWVINRNIAAPPPARDAKPQT